MLDAKILWKTEKMDFAGDFAMPRSINSTPGL